MSTATPVSPPGQWARQYVPWGRKRWDEWAPSTMEQHVQLLTGLFGEKGDGNQAGKLNSNSKCSQVMAACHALCQQQKIISLKKQEVQRWAAVAFFHMLAKPTSALAWYIFPLVQQQHLCRIGCSSVVNFPSTSRAESNQARTRLGWIPAIAKPQLSENYV